MIKLEQNSVIDLPHSVTMPRLGLGLYKMPVGQDLQVILRYAIELGYRHFDTASFYGNEHSLGLGLRNLINEGLVSRQELFITTKIWNNDHGYDHARQAIARSQGLLGLGPVDLHLIHWPVKGLYLETWRALEQAFHDGHVRAIGVSNFPIRQLEILLDHCQESPAVNQVEFHPWLQQADLQAYCQNRNIALCAWSPLMRGACFFDPVIQNLGRVHQRTPAQIILRWELQKGIALIPKTSQLSRLEENIYLYDFELSPADMMAMDCLDRNQRSGLDPASFDH